MKLGASRAVGTDIDPFSITAATQNAALNGLEEQFDLFLCGADMSEPDPLEQVCSGVAVHLHWRCRATVPFSKGHLETPQGDAGGRCVHTMAPILQLIQCSLGNLICYVAFVLQGRI